MPGIDGYEFAKTVRELNQEILEKEGIKYPQIFIPKNNKDDAAKLYGVTGIPQIMLFSPNGNIIQRGLRGKEMIKFVEEQLKK